MIYLLENEAGWDANALGFPSIMGCHAICIATPDGLFGYHNAGGSAMAQFTPRADKFLSFVQTKLGGRTPVITHMYGASFIGNNQRGYTIGKAKQEWRAELEVFAADFNYGGPISGCDLSKWITAGSAYVEYNLVGGTGCSIAIKAWSEIGKVTGVNPNTVDMQKIIGTVQNASMVTSVDRSNLINVIPETIRG